LRQFQLAGIVANASKNKNCILQKGPKLWLRKQRVMLHILSQHWIDKGTFDQIEGVVIVVREGTLLGIAAATTRLEILIFVTNHREAVVYQ
jgi:hypothetical protein